MPACLTLCACVLVYFRIIKTNDSESIERKRETEVERERETTIGDRIPNTTHTNEKTKRSAHVDMIMRMRC